MTTTATYTKNLTVPWAGIWGVRLALAGGAAGLSAKASQSLLIRINLNGRLLTGQSGSNLAPKLAVLAKAAGWKTETLGGSRLGKVGFRAWDGKGRSIQFHPGGSRFDAKHMLGEPYWKVSSPGLGVRRFRGSP